MKFTKKILQEIHKCKSWKIKVLLYFGIPVGLIFSIYNLIIILSFLINSNSTVSTITKIEKENMRFYYTFEYKIKDNLYYYKPNLMLSNVKDYKLGDKFEIMYKRNDYENVRINNFKYTWGSILFSFSFVLFFSLLSYFYIKRCNKG